MNLELDLSDKSYHTQKFSPAQMYDGVFSSEDLKWLTEFMFRSTEHWRRSETGNLFFSGNLYEVVAKFYQKIHKHLDLSEVTVLRGNFFHTPHQYGFHTDMPEAGDRSFYRGDYAYKTILIPLYKLPAYSECHIFFFNERIVCPGVTLDKGPNKSTTHYTSLDSYEEINGLFNVKGEALSYEARPFDKKIFEEYNLGKTFKKIRFEGFEIESVFSWRPGSMIVFDTCQLHCSNIGLEKKYFKTKAALRLSLWHNGDGEIAPHDFSVYENWSGK